MTAPYKIELPWPVSANRYWRRAGTHMHVSTEARDYRKQVVWTCRNAPCFGRERIGISVVAYPPDNRRRDLDNVLKVLFDSLQAARVFEDDSQIRGVFAVWAEARKEGAVLVSIRRWDKETAQRFADWGM